MLDLKEVRQTLKKITNGRLRGWMGQRASDCIGLSKIFPVDFILSCDYGIDIAEWTRNKFLLSIEKHNRIRKNWSNNHLAEAFNTEIGKYFENFRKNRKLDIACYRSVSYLEKSLQADADRLIAAPLTLKNYFDNKLRLYRNLPRLGLNVIPGEITSLAQVSYARISRKYGLPFVVQLPVGSSGNNTFFIFNEQEFGLILPRLEKSEFKVSRYLPSYSLNINVVIYKKRMLLSSPSIQIVGVKECTNRPAIFCGNDFTHTKFVPPNVIQRAYDATQRLADWMQTRGYRGVFGLDLLVADDEIYPIEINPRWQNSTDVLTISQLRQNQVPLISFHLLEFLTGPSDDSLDAADEDALFRPQEGAQIILHNLERKSVVNAQTIQPGIYKLIAGDLVFQRYGNSLFDCHEADDFIITCAVPYPQQKIESGAPLCKIQSFRSMLQPNRIELNQWAASIAKKIYQNFELH